MIRFIADGGLFMIPLGLMGLVILLLGGERLFSLFVKKDHAAETSSGAFSLCGSWGRRRR